MFPSLFFGSPLIIIPLYYRNKLTKLPWNVSYRIRRLTKNITVWECKKRAMRMRVVSVIEMYLNRDVGRQIENISRFEIRNSTP